MITFRIVLVETRSPTLAAVVHDPLFYSTRASSSRLVDGGSPPGKPGGYMPDFEHCLEGDVSYGIMN
jgi:hypothetical protein